MTRIRRSFDLPPILSMRINAAARERRVLLRELAEAAFTQYLDSPPRPILIRDTCPGWRVGVIFAIAVAAAFLAGLGTGRGLL